VLPQLAFALGLAAAAPADPDAVLAAILEEARAKHDVPAAAAWVSRRGEKVAVAAVGLRREGGTERVTLDDRFHLGSVSKSLNAVLIATLVDEGRLRWDEPIEKLFPDWPVHRALRGVTLAQLLAHHSGIAGFRGSGDFADAPRLYGDARSQRMQFTQWLIAQKPATEVGQFSYSNAGVAIAAAAAERVTGKPWEDLMRERVFAPLGMTRAGFGWPGRAGDHEPWGHYLRGALKVPHDPSGPYEVAVDSSHLYWADSGDITIVEASLDGTRLRRDALVSSLTRLCQQAPLLMVLDTCEVLSADAEEALRSLLVEVCDRRKPVLVMIASRLAPDVGVLKIERMLGPIR